MTLGFDFTVGMEFPGVADIEMTTFFSGSFRNERSNSFETSFSNVHESRFVFQNDDGKQCKFELQTTTCSAVAQGQVPVVAQGIMLVKFPNRVSKTGICPGYQ